jgi:deoxyadenosine/deoxycytidine kinase
MDYRFFIESSSIGGGKTTAVHKLADAIEEKKRVRPLIFEEIFDKNLLEKMYNDIKNNVKPSLNVFQFEVSILASRMEQYCFSGSDELRFDEQQINHQGGLVGFHRIAIYDRSLHSCRAFSTMLHKDGFITKEQDDILESLYLSSVKIINDNKNTYDVFCYLDVPIKTQLERIRRRGRNGEESISAVYLERLNKEYAVVRKHIALNSNKYKIFDWSEFRHDELQQYIFDILNK